MNAPAPTKTTLFTLVDAYITALSRVDEETGEIDAETRAVLDALTPQLGDKLEACAAVVARFDAESEANDVLAKQYHAKSVAREREAKRVKAYMLEQMQRAGLKKVRGASHSVWIASTPHVEVDDIKQLDPRFVRVKPEEYAPDKKAIAAALDAGEVVTGARLVTEENVRFR